MPLIGRPMLSTMGVELGPAEWSRGSAVSTRSNRRGGLLDARAGRRAHMQLDLAVSRPREEVLAEERRERERTRPRRR